VTSARRPARAYAIKTDTTHGSGLSPVVTTSDLHKPYTWRGDRTGMPDAEVAARIAQARATAAARHGQGTAQMTELERSSVHPDRSHATRNGLPPTRPYVYQGTGKSLRAPTEIAERIRRGRRSAPAEPVAVPPRAPSRAQAEDRTAALLAIDTEIGAAPPAPPGPERCDECGYLTARCCCPGGPRGWRR
jgi:hypothetical protein